MLCIRACHVGCRLRWCRLAWRTILHPGDLNLHAFDDWSTADNSPSLQPTHSITVSIINPSYACLPTASKDTALPRSHPPRQPNPHSGVRGILRAPSPAGSFLGGFRTPATGVCRADVAGPHPKPSTNGDICLPSRHVRSARQKQTCP